MAPESSITVTVNSRKAVSGKKIIRTISMLVILLVIAFPFLWLIISSFKHLICQIKLDKISSFM